MPIPYEYETDWPRVAKAFLADATVTANGRTIIEHGQLVLPRERTR